MKKRKNQKKINEEIELKNYSSTSEIHQCIDRAIREKKRIHIEYNSKYNDEYTKREISPIKKFREKERTYLQAYCHKRKDERIYKSFGNWGMNGLIKLLERV